IYAENKKADLIFDISDKIKLEIEYSVLEDLKGTNLALELYKDGILLFRTWDIDKETQLFINREKGNYITYITLPDYLLMGTYSISIAAGRSGVGLIKKHEDCLVFD